LVEWKKYPGNPVVAEKPEGVNSTDFRDPYVWRSGDRWQMVIGAGMEDGDSAILLYESEDLLDWRYLGPAFRHRTLESVRNWECPNFFPLDGKFVLLISLSPDTQGVYYYVGDFDGQVFTPESQGFLESSGILYAPQVQQFPDGRTLLFGWLREQRSDEVVDEAGWAGVLAAPRELALDQQGRLTNRLVREFQALRKTSFMDGDLSIIPGECLPLSARGRQLEVELSVSQGNGEFELGLAASPEDKEVTLIGCDLENRRVWLDTTRSSLSGEVMTGIQEITFPDVNGETVHVRVLLDGSVVEVWVDDAVSISGRIYPTLEDSQSVFLRSKSEKEIILNLSVWELNGIWDEN